jgi:hypothetical protein
VGCIVVVNASPTLLKTASRRPSAPSAVGEGNAICDATRDCGPWEGGVATAVTRATRPRVGAVRTGRQREVATHIFMLNQQELHRTPRPSVRTTVIAPLSHRHRLGGPQSPILRATMW